MSQSPSYEAGADLIPSRFVKLDPTNDHTVLPAGAGEKTIGVTHEGTREAPIPGITPLAAKAGESCRIYGNDETCEVEAGGAIAVDEDVASDADGKAVPATVGTYAAGRAVAAAADGEMCRILVHAEPVPVPA